MSHPEFLRNPASRKEPGNPKKGGPGKTDLLCYTVENENDREQQEVIDYS